MKDFLNTVIPALFYMSELQKIEKDPDSSLWLVEKVLKKRRRRGKTEYLVKFEGWPSRFNSWVSSDNIQSIDNITFERYTR